MKLGKPTKMDYAFDVESQTIASLANLMARNILPLFAEVSNGKPKLIGSGFLISSSTDYYLVSAAHVFDEMRDGNELFFFIEPNTKRKLSGSLRLTETPEGKVRKHDRLDIGVLKLEGTGLPPYPKVDKYPLEISALRANVLPRESKQYLIVGYPETKSRANPIERKVTSKIYGFRSVSVPLEKYAVLGVNDQSHIVLSFDVKHTVGSNKQICAFPEPAGMSGSPVWLLYDENGSNDQNQTPVVGIAIEHHKSCHAIVATDIGVALRLINEDT